LVTPVPLSPLLLLCCAYGGGSIKISLWAMPYNCKTEINVLKGIVVHRKPSILIFCPHSRFERKRGLNSARTFP
jgi:hypothetical protein